MLLSPNIQYHRKIKRSKENVAVRNTNVNKCIIFFVHMCNNVTHRPQGFCLAELKISSGESFREYLEEN